MLMISLIGILFILITVFKFQISLLHLLSLYFGVQIFNLNFMSEDIALSDTFIRVHLLAIIFFYTPFIFYKSRVIKYELTYENVALGSSYNRDISSSFRNAVLLFIFLTIYHYYIVGIPIFSNEVETIRFAAAQSGLFGIPSRIAVYGPAILFFTSIILYLKGFLSNKIFYFSLITIGVLLSFQGSKSSLVQIIFLGIICFRFLPKKFVKQIWPLVLFFTIISFSYIYYVFSIFSSSNDLEFFSYLAQRMSVISQAPKIALIDEDIQFKLFTGSIFFNDLFYPFSKVLGMDIETSNIQLSRFIYNIEDGDFTVPVTPGITAYAFVELGEIGAYIFMLLLSLFILYLYHKTTHSHSIYSIIFILTTEYLLYVGITSGNIFYLVGNTYFIVLFLWFFERVFYFFRTSLFRRN